MRACLQCMLAYSTCMHACMHTHTYTHAHGYVQVCPGVAVVNPITRSVYKNDRSHTHIHACIHANTHNVHSFSHLFFHSLTLSCLRTRARARTHTHTFTHTFTQVAGEPVVGQQDAHVCTAVERGALVRHDGGHRCRVRRSHCRGDWSCRASSSSSSIYSQPIRPSALESSSRSQTEEEDSTVPASYNRSLGELSQQALNTFRPERTAEVKKALGGVSWETLF